MTWWQILLAVAVAVWLWDRLTDLGAPAERLAWWHEPRRRPARDKLSKVDQQVPSALHIPTRAPGRPWERPAPATPDMATFGPECPVRFRDLPDDTPAWLAEAFDLAGMDDMLAKLRAERVEVLS
jgi:hypothetical protein